VREVSTERLVELIHMRPQIPAGKCNGVSVEVDTIKAGERIDVVSMRNAIFMGMKPLAVSFTSPLEVRRLKYDGGTWMTDHPQEIWQMDWALERMRGRVLVGGLGLGVVTSYAEHMPRIERTTTVEMDKSIIKLVHRHLESVPEVVCADLFDFVKKCRKDAFDSAFFDIWQATGEYSWTTYVVPLRRLAAGKIKNVVCWLEEEMQEQVNQALYRVCSFPDDDTGMPPHYATFRDAVVKKKIKRKTTRPAPNFNDLMAAEAENRKNKKLIALAELFLKGVGTPAWEKAFGDFWDKNEERSKDA